MRRVHPKPRQAVAFVAAISFVCAGGCRNQTSGLPNPFLAPGRVPPPATRALLPGQAQPYYPGDPLPVMQSSVTPGASGSASNPPAATQFTSNDGLNWGTSSAGSGDPRTTVPATGVGTIANNTTPSSFQTPNEPAIAVPSDGDSLRFPLPTPEPVAAATVAAAPVAAASPTQPVQLAAAAPTSQSVLPAAYLAPVPIDQSTPTLAQLNTSNAPPTGPWRSPQIAPQLSTATLGMPTLGVTQPNSMDVRLRAVPSPPPDPVESTTPRIRIPTYSVPATATGASMLVQPSPTYVAQTSTGPLLQTVQIGPLPPPPGVLAANYAVPQGVAGSGDGFRPRSSQR
jgi:hypothetical protein